MRRDDLQLLINQYDKSRLKLITSENIRITWLKKFLEASDFPNPTFADFMAYLNKNYDGKDRLETLFDSAYLNGKSDSAKIFKQFISADLFPKENKNEVLEPPKASAVPQTFFTKVVSTGQPNSSFLLSKDENLTSHFNIYTFYKGLFTLLENERPESAIIKLLHAYTSKYPIDINQQDKDGKTIAHYLIERLNKSDVKYAEMVLKNLFKQFPNINLGSEDYQRHTPLTLCSQDPSRSEIMDLLMIHHKQFKPLPPSKTLFNILAQNPSQVIVGRLDSTNEQQKNSLMGHPHISECHCSESLSRTEKPNLRDDYEQQMLQYLRDLPYDNVITIIGPGKLLDTIILIAKFKQENPQGKLQINLIDHVYNPSRQDETRGIIMDFLKVMNENGVNVEVEVNETGLNLPKRAEGGDFTLVVNFYGEFEHYLKEQKQPKVLAAVDLDLEHLKQDQHQFVADCAKDAGALSFVSVNRDLMKTAVFELKPASKPKNLG